MEGKENYESAPNGSKIPLGGQLDATRPRTASATSSPWTPSCSGWPSGGWPRRCGRPRPTSAFAITMDLKTGQVLALANAPSFDSARPAGRRSPRTAGTGRSAAPYEPGSVQKILTAAALVDSGTATPETRVKVPNRLRHGPAADQGPLRARGAAVNMRGVVARSSNIGTAMLARQMTKQQLHRLSGPLRSRRPHRHRAARRVGRHRARRPTCRTDSGTRWPSARPSR